MKTYIADPKLVKVGVEKGRAALDRKVEPRVVRSIIDTEVWHAAGPLHKKGVIDKSIEAVRTQLGI